MNTRNRGINFDGITISLHTLSEDARYTFYELVNHGGSSTLRNVKQSPIDIIRELNSLYYQIDGDGYTIYSVFDTLAYDETSSTITATFTNKMLLDRYKAFVATAGKDEYLRTMYIGLLKGRYSMALVSLLEELLPGGGEISIPYDQLVNKLGFPASYRSSHVIAEIDKSVKEIEDTPYIVTMLGYTVERLQRENAIRKSKPTAITFAVTWGVEPQ